MNPKLRERVDLADFSLVFESVEMLMYWQDIIGG
jgi:hypothetical protein